jgi:hypothetical protein
MRHLPQWMRPRPAAAGWQFLPGTRARGLSAARRGGHHRRVELSAAAQPLAGGQRVGGRQSRDAEAFGTGAAHGGPVGASGIRSVSRGLCHRSDRRAGDRRGLRGAALRSLAFHRLDARGQAHHALGQRAPDAGDPGAGRQVARAGASRFSGANGGGAHHGRQAVQRRPDVYCAGLRAGGSRRARGIRAPGIGRRRHHVSEAGKQSGLSRASSIASTIGGCGTWWATRYRKAPRCWR